MNSPNAIVKSNDWTDPKPLPDVRSAVSPFDFTLLPTSLRPWIEDIAERMQCPPDFPAVAAMVALAGTVGRRVGIRPKRQDDWVVVPNLWGAAIGPPGVLKSPAIDEPLKPLKRLEAQARESYRQQLADHDALLLVARSRRKKYEKGIDSAINNNEDALAIARQAIEEEPKPPTERRFIVNDSTVEKLGEILKENPAGVIVVRDELTGLLRSLDREGQECSRAFYLEAWNGTGDFNYDRIGRGRIYIPAACISIIGGIQPGPLREYLLGAIRGGAGDDGLMQRFQLAVWPDISEDWRNVDRWPDSAARKTASETFCRLTDATADDLGASTEQDHPAIPFLRFAPDGQELFDEWRDKLERQLRSGGEQPLLESHLAKYRSLIPSLALLIHLAEAGTGQVSVVAITRAIRWAHYLETHARRIYAVATSPVNVAARELATRIQAGELSDGFKVREVYRHGWSGLTRPDDVEAAAELLAELAWLRIEEERTGGRPTSRCWINPKILDSPRAGTDKTVKSLVGIPFGGFGSPSGESEKETGAVTIGIGAPGPRRSENTDDEAQEWGVV